MSKVSNVDNFIEFVEKMYFPLLVEYGVLPDDEKNPEKTKKIKTIYRQKVVNRLNKSTDRDAYFENYRSMINLITDGGIVYQDENGTQFEDINEAFITSTLGTMAGLCKKHGVKMEEYDLGSMILPTSAEERVANTPHEDFVMFLTGDSNAFHNKYGTKTKSELEQLRQRILESVETTKTNPIRKTF